MFGIGICYSVYACYATIQSHWWCLASDGTSKHTFFRIKQMLASGPLFSIMCFLNVYVFFPSIERDRSTWVSLQLSFFTDYFSRRCRGGITGTFLGGCARSHCRFTQNPGTSFILVFISVKTWVHIKNDCELVIFWYLCLGEERDRWKAVTAICVWCIPWLGCTRLDPANWVHLSSICFYYLQILRILDVLLVEIMVL